MKSKPYVVYLVLGVAAMALWLAWHSANRPPVTPSSAPIAVQAPPPEPADASTPAKDALSSPANVPGGSLPAGASPAVRSAGSIPANAVAPDASPVNAAGPAAPVNQTAQINVERVRHMINDYHTLMGENPVGTNAEIMKQMIGGNSRQATLGPPEGLPLNGQGELVDPWGTPYFFHQLSRDKMEVRSAGPDKVMWTADDVISR